MRGVWLGTRQKGDLGVCMTPENLLESIMGLMYFIIIYQLLFWNFSYGVTPENLLEYFLHFDNLYWALDTIFQKGDPELSPQDFFVESFMQFCVLYRLFTTTCVWTLWILSGAPENLLESFVHFIGVFLASIFRKGNRECHMQKINS